MQVITPHTVVKRPGIIDTPNDVGGYPVYNSTTAPADSNNDGIPDGWLETSYPGKTATQLHESGYSYAELYINSLVQHIVDAKNQGALTSGIKDNLLASDEIKIGRDGVTLTLTSATTMQSLTIRDLTGSIILHRNIRDVQTVVQLADLKPAIYLLTIGYDGQKSKTVKMVW